MKEKIFTYNSIKTITFKNKLSIRSARILHWKLHNIVKEIKGDIKKCKDIYIHELGYLILRWQHSTNFSAYSMQSLSKLQPTFHRDWQDTEIHMEIQITNNSQKQF